MGERVSVCLERALLCVLCVSVSVPVSNCVCGAAVCGVRLCAGATHAYLSLVTACCAPFAYGSSGLPSTCGDCRDSSAPENCRMASQRKRK